MKKGFAAITRMKGMYVTYWVTCMGRRERRVPSYHINHRPHWQRPPIEMMKLWTPEGEFSFDRKEQKFK